MSFGQIARLSAVMLLSITAITASAQDNVVTLTSPTIEGGIAYILPESHDSAMCKSRIVSAEIKDTIAEVVRRSDCQPRAVPAIVCYEPCDWTVRKIWKDIYKVQGDKLVFQKRIDGKIIPAQAERIEWPKELTTLSYTISGSSSGVLYASSGTGSSAWTDPIPATLGSGDSATAFFTEPPPCKKKRHYRRTR